MPARQLSHGDRKKLELAMALAVQPHILVLDEPAAGMAAKDVDELIDLIERVHDTGAVTVVLIEHDLDIVFRLAKEMTVLHMGRVIFEGAPSEALASDAVRDAYLGEQEIALPQTERSTGAVESPSSRSDSGEAIRRGGNG